MNKSDVKRRIKGLNEHMLKDSSKKLVWLNISRDYTYNKAIAIVDKALEQCDWYSVNHKNCFRTWHEADIFLDGLCLGVNTDFEEKEEEKER